jgi:hypothetical protein
LLKNRSTRLLSLRRTESRYRDHLDRDVRHDCRAGWRICCCLDFVGYAAEKRGVTGSNSLIELPVYPDLPSGECDETNRQGGREQPEDELSFSHNDGRGAPLLKVWPTVSCPLEKRIP